MLVELADFYDVDIREIIDGERKSEKMDEEMKATLVKAAQYAGEEKKKQIGRMRKGIGGFLIMSAFAVFPSESGWGAKFAILGALTVAAGIFQLLEKYKIPVTIGAFAVVMIGMIAMDFVSVCYIRQAPRFAYMTDYGDTTITYYAPFYSVVRYDHDTADENYEIHIGKSFF